MKDKIHRLAKYSSISLFTSIVDIGLFYLFLMRLNTHNVENSIFLSTILARIISALMAYELNKHFVFKTQNISIKRLLKYYSAIGIQMLLSATFVTYVDYLLGINEMIEKAVVDIILFFLLYFVNKFWIFKEDNI